MIIIAVAYPRGDDFKFTLNDVLNESYTRKTINGHEGGFIQHTTGAPDVVISKCTSYIENGKIIPLTEEKRQFFTNENKRLASKALRVLAAGYREWDTQPAALSTEDENNLVFLGLVGMIDPV